MKRSPLLPALALLTGLSACDPDASGPVSDAPAPAGKADAFDPTGFVTPLRFDENAHGEVAGESIRIYRIDAAADSEITIGVVRQSGDLRPQAFLYENLDALASGGSFLPPRAELFEPGEDSLDAGWRVDQSQALFLVVAAGNGTAGSYSLTLGCHDGECEAAPPVATTFGQWVELAQRESVDDWASLPTTLQMEGTGSADAIEMMNEVLLDEFSANGFELGDSDELHDAVIGEATTVDLLDPDTGEVLGLAIGVRAVLLPADCLPGDDCGIETATIIDAAAFLDFVSFEIVATVFEEH